MGWSSLDLYDKVYVRWVTNTARNNNTIFAHESTDDELTNSRSDYADRPVLSIKKNMTMVKMMRPVHRMR